MMLRPMRPKPLMPTLMGILPPMDFVKRRRALRCETTAKPNPKCYGVRKEKSTRSQTGEIRCQTTTSGLHSEYLLRVLLDVRYAIAVEADEHSFRRWLAVDPVLDVVALIVALANFV